MANLEKKSGETKLKIGLVGESGVGKKVVFWSDG